MKLTRTLVLIFSATLLFAGCNKESDEAVVTAKENTNPLLAYVPADTAYVFADLEPVPAEITDAYVTRFQPVLDVMSETDRASSRPNTRRVNIRIARPHSSPWRFSMNWTAP